MNNGDRPRVVWSPAPDARSSTRMGRYLTAVEERTDRSFGDYNALWKWSVEEIEEFWASIWDHFEVVSYSAPTAVLTDRSMPSTTWFPGATLNYAEHALRGNGLAGNDTVVVAASQTRPDSEMTLDGLRDQVARCAAGLRRLGVAEGDRVCAYLPNVPETLVAFLATASIGAVWSSCAPEFGAQSVADRWSQIEPSVLLAVDGYVYGDKQITRTKEVAELRTRLTSLEHVIHVPYLKVAPSLSDAVAWDDLLSEPAELTFTPVPFAHPLYVLYSSGTTGLPKAIVHGHGGILIEHTKNLALHLDLGPGDSFFWFSTTGWMMWNYLVSGLLVGAAIVLFDGNPAYPDLSMLWALAAQKGVTYFGTSAPFLMACCKEGLEPGLEHDLSSLRGVGSTASPLPAAGFDWVYDSVGPDLLLGSASGGTDVCTGFVGASPLVEVRAGEIPCRLLGCRVEAFDEEGRSIIGRQGELVITAPMPSMPIGFWGDDDGSRYRDAYFDTYPGVWRHGDWITITPHGSCVISGRSDATLNRGGVRMGTGEFYAVVEAIDQVGDSMVIHLEADEGGAGTLLLFIAPPTGSALDAEVRSTIADRLRSSLSPRHVPDEIVIVPEIPRTLSGKKLEVPVKAILRGIPADRAASKGALANPAALEPFVDYAASRRQA